MKREPGFLDDPKFDNYNIDQMRYQKTHPKLPAPDAEFVEPSEEWMEVVQHLIIDDHWDERLLSQDIFGSLEELLEPREFFILEEMVRICNDPNCNKDYEEGVLVGSMKKNSPQGNFMVSSLSARKSEIKTKITRHNQDKLPGWIRSKIWESNDNEKTDNG